MNVRLAAGLLALGLLAGCAADPRPPVSSSSSSSPQVELSAGDRDSQEGRIGDDELDTPTADDRHVHLDDQPTATDLKDAAATADEVVVGWLTRDQAQRRQRLTGRLAEALIDSLDDPRYTPVADRQLGPAHVVQADQMQVITRHRLDTGTAVDLTLILEPDAPRGWIAISIAER